MTALATSATNTNTPSSFSPDTIDNTSSNNNNSSSLNKITNNNSNSLASFLERENSSNGSTLPKKYSLLKWLENSQFDFNNEQQDRLASVPHTNIIDYESEDLKAGMVISVFRNSGEIWRAQIIIPRTSLNSVDLPSANNHKQISKIHVKSMATNSKLSDLLDSMDTASEQSPLPSSSSNGMNQNLIESQMSQASSSSPSSQTLLLLTNSNCGNLSPSILSTHHLLNNTSTPIQLNTLMNNQQRNSISQNNNNNYRPGKDVQFLQNVLSEADLSDLYQTLTNSTDLNTNNTNGSKSSYSFSGNSQQVAQSQQSNEMTIENIMQMQTELLEQQKDLKAIENVTMDQLKLLQLNLTRLAKKFDSFENVVFNHMSNSKVSKDNNSYFTHSNTLNSETKGLVAQLNLNKLSSSLQQIKIIENELQKDFLATPMSPNSAANMMINGNHHSNHQTRIQQQQRQQSSGINLSLINSEGNTPSGPNNFVLTQTLNKFQNGKVKQRKKQTRNKFKYEPKANGIHDVVMSKETEELMSQKIQGIQSQIALNRYIREMVKEKVGIHFLYSHAIAEIPSEIMQEIKKDAFSRYLPSDRRPLKAWGLAMASLRCLKRDLVKNKNKYPDAQSTNNNKANIEITYNNLDLNNSNANNNNCIKNNA